MFRLIVLIFISVIVLIGCGKKDRIAVMEKGTVLDTLPHERMIGGLLVKGKVIDDQTRCSHYHTQLDIIAIKFKCCDTYYPCYSCHAESVDHQAVTWEINERDEKAILCGACGHQLTIEEYMASNNTCTQCQSSFNPNCKKHYDLYFTME